MEDRKRTLLGLVEKRPRWGLSRMGVLVACLITSTSLGLMGFGLHPYLAVSNPQKHGYLVVEGWLPDYALEDALRIFHSNDYQAILTTGVPLEIGFHLSEYKDYSQLARESLLALSNNHDLPVFAVPTPFVEKNRTYSTAKQVREWFENQNMDSPQMDILTLGVHARRSRLLFQKVFGDTAKIGVWSITDRDYLPERWWAGSEGVKQTLTECLGYAYARLGFGI